MLKGDIEDQRDDAHLAKFGELSSGNAPITVHSIVYGLWDAG